MHGVRKNKAGVAHAFDRAFAVGSRIEKFYTGVLADFFPIPRFERSYMGHENDAMTFGACNGYALRQQAHHDRAVSDGFVFG
jgi:hypothetical protein